MINQAKHVDGDAVLKAFIAMSEIAWIDANWLENQLAKLVGGDLETKLYCARLFRDIWQKLPLTFFGDEDKRKQILDAFEELMTVLAEQEEEEEKEEGE